MMSDDRPSPDLLAALSAPTRLGERTARRLEHRRWGTLGGDRREKLFERMGLANPWDPDAPDEPPVSLGPVGLKLTDRRQPAPHAKPPSRGGEDDSPKRFQPTGIPRAKAPPAPARSAPLRSAPVKAPVAAAATQAPAEDQAQPLPLPLPLPPKRSRSGRVRMASRTETSAPVFKKKPAPEAPVEAPTAAPAPAPAPAPVNRTPPGGDMGLDDLFGFSEGGGSRMRLRPKKAEPEDS